MSSSAIRSRRRACRKGRLLGPALAAMALLTALAAACGGGSGPKATPTPQPTTAASPTAGATPSGSPPANIQRVIDLANDKPLSVIWGIDAGDFRNDLPQLVSGDFNGDGKDDLLMGARFADGPQNGREDSGEAYVVFGAQDLPASIDLAGGDHVTTVFGAAAGQQLGFSAAAADLNDDGKDDIILGSPFALHPKQGAPAGIVDVIFGRSDFPKTIDLANTKADLSLWGPGGSAFFGDSLASGDVNGDDLADLIIGSTFASHPVGPQGASAQVGAVFAVFGSADLAGVLDTTKGQYDAAIYGAEEFDEVGDMVASGDVNGDGLDDIIAVGEAADGPGNTRSVAGDVIVVYGKRDLSGDIEIARDQQDVIVYGAAQNDTMGFNLAAADLNGDGVEDILMVARLADGPEDQIGEAGELHIVYGRDDIPSVIDAAKDQTDAYLYGVDPADFLGTGLWAADLTNAGKQELLLGVSGADGPGNSRMDGGEAYVIMADDLSGAVAVTAAPALLAVYGVSAGDGLGSSITAGDLNGDGKPELIIQAAGGDGPNGSRVDAGQFYVLDATP